MIDSYNKFINEKNNLNSNFKQWFGNSKVVDDKGNPLVVYHGTSDDISEFDESFGGSHTFNNIVGAFYYTDTYEVAEDYSINSYIYKNKIEIEDNEIEEFKEKNPDIIKVIDVYLKIENPIYLKSDNGHVDTYKTDEYINYIKNNESELDEVREFFEENGWYDENDIESYKEEIIEYYKTENDIDVDTELSDEMFKEAIELYAITFGYIEKQYPIYDGIIWENVYDAVTTNSYYVQTVYIAIKPNQIKSASKNNGNYNLYNKNIFEKNDTEKSIKKYNDYLNYNFKQWFGDSKVVDSNGNPLIVYHGSKNIKIKTFNDNKPIWFSTYKGYAEIFKLNDGKLYEVFLKIENPMYVGDIDGIANIKKIELLSELTNIKIEILSDILKQTNGINIFSITNSTLFKNILQERGYDGIIAKEGGGITTYAVFSSNQIKSATNNNGNFDLNSNNINENNGFKINSDKWNYFYDIFMKDYSDNDNRDNALDILYTIKNNNYWCTKKQYDTLKNFIENKNTIQPYEVDDSVNDTVNDISNKKYFTTIPLSAIDNYYMNFIKKLKHTEYNFFIKLIKTIKNRYEKNNKTDNNLDVTEREYILLKRLKDGIIKPSDYSTKN